MPNSFFDRFAGPAGSLNRDRLFLFAGCVVAVTLAIALRDDRPVAAAVSTTQALQLVTDATSRHNALAAAHAEGELTDAEFADRLESESASLWNTASQLMAQSRADGAGGRRFEEIARFCNQRYDLTGTLCEALRSGDSERLAASLAAWQEAELDEPILPGGRDVRPTIGGG